LGQIRLKTVFTESTFYSRKILEEIFFGETIVYFFLVNEPIFPICELPMLTGNIVGSNVIVAVFASASNLFLADITEQHQKKEIIMI